MDNLMQQKDEIEALSSIFHREWKQESDSGSYFSMEIESDVTLYITLNSDYPSESPPIYQLLAPSLNRTTKQRIENSFATIYLENVGAPVIFQWIECLRGIVYEFKKSTLHEPSSNLEEQEQTKSEEIVDSTAFNIIHGPTILDRKSTFQGHFCKIKSQNDVRPIIDLLLQNKKISQAAHNVSAYRIKAENGNIVQDHDEGGEHHAGSRLMHLLQILDVTDVLVVVSRWYGGIQLGPDRFRHYNNAARQVLTEAGIIKK